MGKIIELTGAPCSGKSYFYKVQVKQHTHCNRNLFYHIASEFRFVMFGVFQLGLKKSLSFLFLSLKEDTSFLFKLNIFRNILRKVGVAHSSALDGYDSYVDEGVSHIPFNLLSSDTENIIEMIKPYLIKSNVVLVTCLDKQDLKQRLLTRGHSRLKFVSVDEFVEKATQVEEVLLSEYPSICSEFEVYISD